MSNFHAVIGNNDYIKLNDIKIPFWELLDELPDGWFCSVVYKRNDIPTDRPRIWDCGAWTYRDMEVPKIGAMEVNAANIFNIYTKYAKDGDFIIAPDHIIRDNMYDKKSREIFNKKSAEEFLDITKDYDYIPIASVQGETLEEKIKNTEYYLKLGYKAIALGGLAVQSSKVNKVINLVSNIRQEFPDIWIHVLGLSAPRYSQFWEYLKINSYDGSSHFKRAFTAGCFYVSDNERLLKYQASRIDEPITAPLCNCKACIIIRKHGLDTRSYGCNQRNMGRAAHNLNQLIKSIKIARTTPLTEKDLDQLSQ